MPRKILVVAATFYPVNTPRSHRTTELVKEFARQGHTVTVLTPKDHQHHAAFEEKYNVIIKDIGKRKWKIFTIKSKGLMRLFERALVRFSNLLFEYPDIELKGMVKKALKKESSYDLMISVAVPYPVHWGVASARSAKHSITKIWVADCGDPYMGDTLDTFRKPFYFKYAEKNFCRKADFISVPTKGSVQGYYPEFHHKIKIIPQGFNLEETPVFTGAISNDVPTFAYAGGFIPGNRDPRELLDFLVQQTQDFKFIIYTSNTDLVQPYISLSGNKIKLRPYIPRTQLLHELSRMDFLVNFTNGTTLATPSKLIDYAIAKRPVLSVDTGKLDTETVQAFLSGDYSGQIKMPDLESYDIRNVAAQFLKLAGNQTANELLEIKP
jgi:Glycosyltransferase Family 4